jgi:hypothetical protein
MNANITTTTSTHGGCYILSSLPSYDDIGVDEYIAWELKIDNILHNIVCVKEEILKMQLVF